MPPSKGELKRDSVLAPSEGEPERDSALSKEKLNSLISSKAEHLSDVKVKKPDIAPQCTISLYSVPSHQSPNISG